MSEQYRNTLCWFRRDLRSCDHAALYQALKNSRQVYCVFVFDSDILEPVTDRADRRVEFIWHSVRELQRALESLGGGLIIRHGSAVAEIPALMEELGADALYFNHDYEPEVLSRDDLVKQMLQARNIGCHSFKDQVIFEKNEILTQDRTKQSQLAHFPALAKAQQFFPGNFDLDACQIPVFGKCSSRLHSEIIPCSEQALCIC